MIKNVLRNNVFQNSRFVARKGREVIVQLLLVGWF